MNTVSIILPYIQLVLSVLLIGCILLQRPSDGIEGALGGGSSTLTQFARRGGERILFYATIVIAILFTASAVVSLLVS